MTCNYVTMFVVLVAAGLKPAAVLPFASFREDVVLCVANN